jgi:hypothetical protein
MKVSLKTALSIVNSFIFFVDETGMQMCIRKKWIQILVQ